jgi:hypothetical protein
MEQDVQDVFITKMTKGYRGQLLVSNEKGRRYLVDIKTRSVSVVE